MRVSSQVVGTALGLLVVNGCSSTDPGGQADGSAGSGGETVASAGSIAGNGGALGGVGGAAGSNPAGAGSRASGSGGVAGANAAGGAGLSSSGGSFRRRRRAVAPLQQRFDYRFDTVGFFTAPERRAALEAAGAAWSNIIRDKRPFGYRSNRRRDDSRSSAGRAPRGGRFRALGRLNQLPICSRMAWTRSWIRG